MQFHRWELYYLQKTTGAPNVLRLFVTEAHFAELKARNFFTQHPLAAHRPVWHVQGDPGGNQMRIYEELPGKAAFCSQVCPCRCSAVSLSFYAPAEAVRCRRRLRAPRLAQVPAGRDGRFQHHRQQRGGQRRRPQRSASLFSLAAAS